MDEVYEMLSLKNLVQGMGAVWGTDGKKDKLTSYN